MASAPPNTRASFTSQYEISPIVLVGGAAGAGGSLAISSLLSAQSFPNGVTGGAASAGASFFGHFRLLPGGNLMSNEFAEYPVANQTVAANAVITAPLNFALEMLVPASAGVTFANRRQIMTALKATLDSHTAQGGWYNVDTPSYLYQGCLLRSLTDGTEIDEGGQVQVRFVWNFYQPLITIAAAQAAQNQAMTKISTQTKTTGDPPNSETISLGIGQPSSNIGSSLSPASSGASAATVAPTSQSAGALPSVSSVAPIAPGSLLG